MRSEGKQDGEVYCR